jgi:hypothetical protein
MPCCPIPSSLAPAMFLEVYRRNHFYYLWCNLKLTYALGSCQLWYITPYNLCFKLHPLLPPYYFFITWPHLKFWWYRIHDITFLSSHIVHQYFQKIFYNQIRGFLFIWMLMKFVPCTSIFHESNCLSHPLKVDWIKKYVMMYTKWVIPNSWTQATPIPFHVFLYSHISLIHLQSPI